jgi:hypothetical protein
MNQIVHFNALLDRFKTVLMVPETIRAKSLLVNKEMGTLNVSYFGSPVDGHLQKRPDGVGDNLSGVGSACWWRRNVKIHTRRCDLHQVTGIREEIPGFLNTYR